MAGASRPLAPRQPAARRLGLGESFVVGYSGNLGCAHPVEPVVELIALLADEPGLAFLFIGAGAGYRPLRAALPVASRTSSSGPIQDQALLPQSLTVPDVHLVTLREWEGLVVPSKLYGVLAAGRPVVFIGDPEGDVAQIVRDGPGLVARPETMPALAVELRALRCDPRASSAWAPPPGRPTRPAPGMPAWTPGPVACAPPPGPPRRARSRSRWRRNDRPCLRAPPHRRRRPRSLRGAGHPGNRSVAWRIAWHIARASSKVPWSCRRAGRRLCCAPLAPASATAW